MFRQCFAPLLLLGLLPSFVQPASGQMINRVVPPQTYYDISLREFHFGDFQKALGHFNGDLRNAVKIPDAQGQQFLWLDSMTYLTMCGECHYQMGRYDEALSAFNNALQVYLIQPEWLKSITYAGSPTTVPRQPLPWGPSARQGSVGDFKNCRFQILQENINIIPLGRHGVGLAQQQSLTSIHADEIVARMALMIRRRAELLGPLSKYDPETKTLTELLGARPCLPNHFTRTWVDVLYGLALSAMGDDAAAIAQLQNGLLMEGTYDHHLTAVALNELGHIALRAGKPEDAITHYFEASLSAFVWRDAALLGETFRNMADAQKLIDKTKPTAPLPAALQYFQTLRGASPMILVPLCHEIAEDALTRKDLKRTAELLNQAVAAMSRREISETIHGARNHYLRAMLSYGITLADHLNGKPLNLRDADRHLETALGFLRRGSIWLYQLGTIESYFHKGHITVRGPITVRVADEIYEHLLRDPTHADWALRPMDSLAVMTFAPAEAYQRWFSVAYQRGDREKAFEISERARRAKFYSSFPLGPRILSLRILFEGGPGEVDRQMLLERQTLSLDFDYFAKLSRNVADVKTKLQAIPIVPKDPAQKEQQRRLLSELEGLGMVQEAMLRPIALTRTRAPNAFPPIMSLERIRSELPEKTAILVFAESLGALYGFLIDKQSLEMWEVIQPSRAPSLQKLITDYLEGIGNRDMNRAVAVKDIADPNGKWKKTGNALLKRLLGTQRQVAFTELVIVPTGPLWYVPFESMTVEVGGQLRPLIASGTQPLSIRYAPMASLGFPRKGGRGVASETLVVYGRFFSRDAPTVALDALDRYAQEGIRNLVPMASISSDPNFVEFPGSASTFVTQIKQLVVLDDIPTPRSGGPLDWSPFNGDKTKLNNPVASWLTLPWGGPQLVVLPGFHTPAEHSLGAASRGAKAIPSGDDLFLSAMTLQACGAQTILISRWRTGGRASYDLVGEFLKNGVTLSASDAWRQAIIDVGVSPLRLDEEPRVRSSTGDEPPLANHPFFWGAFLLIDRGEKPDAVESTPREGGKLN